jgi:hypothetical protein
LAHGTQPVIDTQMEVEGYLFTCDAEMAEHVMIYVDLCRKLTLEQRWIELNVTDALQAWDRDLGGTADYVTYSAKQRLLRVVDFKYGAGVFVSADDNKQAMIYALGALLSLNKPADVVEVYIVQPRFEGAEPVRSFKFPALDLLDFAGTLGTGAEKTRQPNAPLIAGAWCKKTFCPNAATCPELERMQNAVIKQEFAAAVPYDPAILKTALDQIPLVEQRIAAIKAFAYERACAGDAIPGYKLVAKKAMRQWTDRAAVVKWADERAIDPYETPELKSPAQLEKGLGKADKEALKNFYASVSSGTTLVPEGDKRPPISAQVTATDFEIVGNEAAPKQLTADNLFQ